MARVEVLLMDVGNVMVRLKTGRLFQALLDACPGLDEAALKAALREENQGAHLAYERGEIRFEDFHADFVRRYGMRWSLEEFRSQWNDYFETNRPMDALVGRLRGQAEFWGLSNTNDEHHATFRRNFRVFEAFRRIIGSHELGLRKPHPDIYKKALEIVGKPASRVLFVDDHPDNVAAAAAAGMKTFHYTFNDLEFKKTLLDLGFDLPPADGRSAMAC